MSQKLFAFHCEADSVAELATSVQEGLAKLNSSAGSEGATGGGKAAASSGPKVGLPEVMAALAKLKDTVDEKEGKDKKLGIKAVKAVLKKFSVTVSTDLPEDKYGEVVAAAEAALPAEDDEKF